MWMYVLGASSDPDAIRCVVPWRVDDSVIFFGPCKKRIRERLRKHFLREDCNHSVVREEVHIVGVNASTHAKIRKIVWAGRLSQVMTFAEADKRLGGRRFEKLRGCRTSPLHVRPVLKNGRLIGYEHVSDEHLMNDAWVSDLVSVPPASTASRADWNHLLCNRGMRLSKRKLIVGNGTPWQCFDRDCCMLLKNRFFAQGQGIEFDERGIAILRKAQHGRRDIDRCSIFGRSGGKPIGLRGGFLKIEDDLARKFVIWLNGRIRNAAIAKAPSAETPSRRRGRCEGHS